MTETIRVFLLDDHEIVRRGLRELLDAEPDLEVVGESGSAAEAIRRIPALRPDVALHAAADEVVTGRKFQSFAAGSSLYHAQLDHLAPPAPPGGP